MCAVRAGSTNGTGGGQRGRCWLSGGDSDSIPCQGYSSLIISRGNPVYPHCQVSLSVTSVPPCRKAVTSGRCEGRSLSSKRYATALLTCYSSHCRAAVNACPEAAESGGAWGHSLRSFWQRRGSSSFIVLHPASTPWIMGGRGANSTRGKNQAKAVLWLCRCRHRQTRARKLRRLYVGRGARVCLSRGPEPFK